MLFVIGAGVGGVVRSFVRSCVYVLVCCCWLVLLRVGCCMSNNRLLWVVCGLLFAV